jgi:hypothetical protein
MKLECKYVSATEAGGEIFQISFEAVRDQKYGPYFFVQRASLEEDERNDVGIYMETNEEHLIRHYTKLGATLTRNRLAINLPPPTNETIDVTFEATDPEFQEIRRVLPIILPQDVE